MIQPDGAATFTTELLASLVANAPIAVAALDSDYRFLHVNSVYSSVAGRPADALAGCRVDEVLADSAPLVRALDGAAAGRPTEFWIRVRRDGSEGERHWVGVAFRVNASTDRWILGTMMRDVTARTQAEIDREIALGREQMSRVEAERQRDFLRLVLENAPMAISVTEGADHRLSLVSDFAVRVVGLRREAMIGRPISQTFPEAFEIVREVYDRVYSSGQTVTVPDRLIPLPDGRRLWAYSSYAPVVGPDGSPMGVMALSLDISAVKRAQHIVEAQKRILEMMAQGRDLTTVLEAIAGVVQADAAASPLCSILLVSEDRERLAHGAAPGLPPNYAAAIDGIRIREGEGCCGTAAWRRGRVVSTDIATDPLWAGYRDVALAHGLRACWSTPILGSAGHVLGTIALYYRENIAPPDEDVQLVDLLAPTAALAIERCRADEDRQRLLESERRARHDAEAASRSKDEFVATLSHELRTPLNAILGWTRILRTGELDAEGEARALDSIERNTRAQSQLVEDLLDMSRIITGKLRLDVRSVELSSVVEAAIDAVRPAAEAKNIRLQKVVDPRAAPIAGDPDRLQQVVWNLLSNAIKFTAKGGRVQVRLERVNSHVEIVVSDTGTGIAPDLLPRVFDRFQQGEQSDSRTAGLGLGLAISRHIVELHGGTIHALSEGHGHGATFTVKLPLMVALGDRAPGDVHPTAPAATDLGLPQLPHIRILVVEDDEDGRDIVAAILTRAGADVRSGASAAEGLELVRTWMPHVLISDIEMPGEDGYTFVMKLRREPGGSPRELPAIALTAYARVEDRIRALAAGFQMHVPKPVEPAELIAVIRAVLPHPEGSSS